jgi:hypothetical protein
MAALATTTGVALFAGGGVTTVTPVGGCESNEVIGRPQPMHAGATSEICR